MEVKKSKLIDLFIALGCSTANKWNDERLLTKAGTITKIYDKQELTDKQKKLYKEIVAAQKENKEIELVGGGDEDKEEKKADKKKDKPSKDKQKDSDTEGDGSEVEDKDKEEDEGEEKTEKKKGPKKAGGGKGPGVIDSIIEFLGAASAAKPLSKDKCVELLKDRFKDRDETGMRKTVSIQLPSRIRKEKGLAIEKNENGYWIDKADGGSKKDKKKDKAKA